ncbi:MAG: GGDEF domain-containing protein [Halothiobacillaceae bacterium]|mgnify:CR=1 FL=1|nr:GGDEF domain-containing protein [Halothiobacillaceae bacterium]HER34837.1 GGDEF domain-containing protein [Halothiobacillaceae bacterium]
MTCYLTTDDAFRDADPCHQAPHGQCIADRREPIGEAAFLHGLLHCASVGAVLDAIRVRLGEFLTATSICWQVGDERYAVGTAGPSDHATVLPLSLDGQSFGELVVHARLPVDEGEAAVLVDFSDDSRSDTMSEMLATVVHPLRTLRRLEHALVAAEHDALTGLRNRRAFDVALHELHARLARYDGQASLLILDMARFKTINDTYGHDVGDRALARVAEGLGRCLRETDSAYRLGGDEFVMILPETPYHGARRLAARLIDWLRAHPMHEAFGERIGLQANVGLAQWRRGETRDAWFRRADQALYGNVVGRSGRPNGLGRPRLDRLG